MSPTSDHPATSTDRTPGRAGPLDRVRVVEAAGIGPGPFAATPPADLGADAARPRPSPLGVTPSHGLADRDKRSVLFGLWTPDEPGACGTTSLYRQIAAPNRTAHNASATFPVCRVPADPSGRKPL